MNDTQHRPRYLIRHPAARARTSIRYMIPIACPACRSLDVYCFDCEDRHPIRDVQDGKHIAHCDRRDIILDRPCAETPAPTATPPDVPTQPPRSRVMLVGAVCLSIGFVLGVILSAALGVMAGFARWVGP